MEFIVHGMAPFLTQIPVDQPLGPLPAVVMVIVTVGFAILMTISIRRKIARRNAARPSARELVHQMRNHPRVVAGDAQGYTVELHDTARRLSAQLDNKAQRLEKLIEEADQRIAALRSDSGGTPPATGAIPPYAAAAAPAPSNGAQRTDPLTEEIYELADAGRTSVEIAQHLDEQVGKVELILALRAG